VSVSVQQKQILGHNPLGFHRISYAEWGSAGKNPPVLCVHGLTRNGRDFDRLAKALSEAGQVYCPDIAGRGQSDFLPMASFYNYPQYIADMTAMTARIRSDEVDWIGTSMGGIIGMYLAADVNTPIRRLVINDIGPFIPVAALRRISAYVGQQKVFASTVEIETYMREIYAGFGELSDADWRHMATHGMRRLPNGQLSQAYDPAIAESFQDLDKDVDFWEVYDRIRCPTLVLHGERSDVLAPNVAMQMSERGPKAKLVTIPNVGHAPALMDPEQIAIINTFLR
jgi:pimeloyl-ACP methyl ester carboxylesterase